MSDQALISWPIASTRPLFKDGSDSWGMEKAGGCDNVLEKEGHQTSKIHYSGSVLKTSWEEAGP